MKKLLLLAIVALCLFTAASCSSSQHTEGAGIYYWRTVMKLNKAERDFLKKHNVAKLYTRFFDVDREWRDGIGEEVVPNATIAFKDSLPEGVEIIPTIYITTAAIDKMQLKEREYAEKILKRINAICRQNGITFREIQLDCDWTKSTRETFFSLCKAVKEQLDSGQSLSSTIRLHQLIQTPPPVDKGVLMVYNTGNLMEMTTENSIFSEKDIKPYLRDNRLAKYKLPLDVAYPAYGWSVVYSPSNDIYVYSNLLRRTDLGELPEVKKIGDNLYEATQNINLEPDRQWGFDIYQGSVIRVERPSASEILKVKKLIESQLKGKPHSNLLYHLDESQLKHYRSHEINKIFSHN